MARPAPVSGRTYRVGYPRALLQRRASVLPHTLKSDGARRVLVDQRPDLPRKQGGHVTARDQRSQERFTHRHFQKNAREKFFPCRCGILSPSQVTSPVEVQNAFWHGPISSHGHFQLRVYTVDASDCLTS
jgi:hypothetical protein